MIQRRTFIQSVAAWFSSFNLFGKSANPVMPVARAFENPTGWTITWNDLESDKALGYWLALPQSADRHTAFRVLVSRPAGIKRRVNEREVENNPVYDVWVDAGSGRRVFADEVDYEDLDWENITPDFFNKDSGLKMGPGRALDHYVIWDTETIPPTPEAIEVAKHARHGRVIEMIQESRNGHHPLPGRGCSVDDNGERIRIKPEGYVETVGLSEEDRVRLDKIPHRSGPLGKTAFETLATKTWCELWILGDYPKTVMAGVVAYAALLKYIEEVFGISEASRFYQSALICDTRLGERTVVFDNPDFPGDPKYNRIIEMPDEAYT